MIKRIKYFIIFFIVILVAISLIVFHDVISGGVYNGIKLCLTILVPSLFPFMVLSSFLVESSLANIIGKKLNSITRFIFFLPGCSMPTIILALIGGFPVGARSIKSLYQNCLIDNDTSERMAFFCVGSGPAFLIGVVGIGLFHSFSLGIILFVSQSLTSILLGVLLGLKARRKGVCYKSYSNNVNSNFNLSNALVTSVSDTAMATINMCAFVIFFSAVISLLDATNILSFISNILINVGLPESVAVSLFPSLLEITNGCNIASFNHASPLFFAFILSFSSISVMFQIFSALKGINFSKCKFVVFRLFHCFFSVIFTYILMNLFPKSISTFSSSSNVVVSSFSDNIFGSIILLSLCLVFLLSVLTKSRVKPLYYFSKK